MKTRDASPSRIARQRSALLRRRLLSVLVAGCFGPAAALANPTGHQVINGQVSFEQQGSVLAITNSPGAIINWQQFSINAGETTRFIQQSADSSVLNRVVGMDPSQILGNLQSNGRVFLINPNGILFGAGAQVDVGALFASTLDLSNEDFLSGRMKFEGGGNGNLKNEAAITTPSGGQVYLIAPNVDNSGVITAPNGDVLLAAGHSVHLVDSTNPALQVVLSAPGHEALNVGQIVVQGGQASVYGALVRQRGSVSANSAVLGENGRIVFKASGDTMLETGSSTTATGAGTGGEIQVLGKRVGIVGDARVDASGRLGGGTILVGGDYQGSNAAVANAEYTFVGQDTALRADAIASGDGGKVIVWADGTTRAFGSISARGGEEGGDGGFAEVSGKQGLEYRATADLGAAHGKTGTLLLDPTDIVIVGSDCSSECAVVSGSGFAGTGGTLSQPGHIFYDNVGPSTISQAQIQDQSATADIFLAATNSITTEGAFNGGAVVLADGSNLTMQTRNRSDDYGVAPAGIDLTGSEHGASLAFRTAGSGSISLHAGTDENAQAAMLRIGELVTGGQSISLTASGPISMESTVNAGTATISAISAAGIDIGAGASLVGGAISLTAKEAGATISSGVGSQISSSGDVMLSADRMALGGTINGRTVALTPFTAGTAIDVGSSGDTASNTLELSAQELSRISADVLRLGNLGTGPLAITAALTAATGGALQNITQGLSLYSNQAITQSGGAVISGASRVQATGASVDLTESNQTGIIAGVATSGNFRFSSANQVAVSTVDGVSGITLAGSGTGRHVALASTAVGPTVVSIAQHYGALINTNGGGLALSAPGGVELFESGNSIRTVAGTLTAPSTGRFLVNSADDLHVANVAGFNGISTYDQNIDLSAGVGRKLSIDSAIQAGIGEVDLNADQLELNATVNAGMVGIAPVTSGRAVTVGSAECQVAPCLAVANMHRLVAETIAIGNDTPTPAGAIHVAGISNTNTQAVTDRNAVTQRIGLLSNAGVTQSGAIDVRDLVVVAGADVALNNSGNRITNLAAEMSGGNFVLNNAQTLNVTSIYGENYGYYGIRSDNKDVSLTATAGDINLDYSVDAGSGNVYLNAAGAVQGGYVAGTHLNVNAGASINLLTEVASIRAVSSGTAADSGIAIFNAGSVSLNEVKSAGGEGIYVMSYANADETAELGDAGAASGDIRVDGAVDAGSGNVYLAAMEGAIVGTGPIKANALGLFSGKGISVTTQVGNLVAMNYDESGTSHIQIRNTGRLEIHSLAQEFGGNIDLVNTGATIVAPYGAPTSPTFHSPETEIAGLGASGPTTMAGYADSPYPNVSTQSGSISLTANSPLTIDGVVQSQTGAISLLANPSAVGNDNLTINGTVSTGGHISLAAGGAVTINGTVTSPTAPTIKKNLGLGELAGQQSTTTVANTITSLTSTASSLALSSPLTQPSSPAEPEKGEQGQPEQGTVAENDNGENNEPSTKLYCN